MLDDVKKALLVYTPINVSTIWPALMLAASRNDNVNGRTKVLMVSIITKKGFNQSGAPPGSRAAANLEGFNVNDDIISANHKGRAKDRVKIRCLDSLKIYGANPDRLIKMIKKNNELMIPENPFKCPPVVREVWEFIKLRG